MPVFVLLNSFRSLLFFWSYDIEGLLDCQNFFGVVFLSVSVENNGMFPKINVLGLSLVNIFKNNIRHATII